MLHCPYSQMVWTSILGKLTLSPISCTSPLELLESVTLHIDQQHKDLQTLAKLIFCTYIWHIRIERIRRIFRDHSTSTFHVVNRIIITIQSRVLFLGLSIPNSISCHWDFPPAPTFTYKHTQLTPATYSGWRLSIYCTQLASIGVLWDYAAHPIEGVTQSAMNFYSGILRLRALIPGHLPSLLLEIDYSLSQVMRLP